MCQNSGKFELSNFKKSHCAHIAKHMIFFGEALVVIRTLKKNVLVVMCTFNLKIKILSLWAIEVIHYIKKISPQNAIVKPLQQGA